MNMKGMKKEHQVDTHLSKIWIGKVDALVDGNLETLVVDHSPMTFVAIWVNCNIWSWQM